MLFRIKTLNRSLESRGREHESSVYESPNLGLPSPSSPGQERYRYEAAATIRILSFRLHDQPISTHYF